MRKIYEPLNFEPFSLILGMHMPFLQWSSFPFKKKNAEILDIVKKKKKKATFKKSFILKFNNSI